MDTRSFWFPHHSVVMLLFVCLGFPQQTSATPRVEAQLSNARQYLSAGAQPKAIVAIAGLRDTLLCEDHLEAWLLACKELGKYCRDTLAQPALALKVFSLALEEPLWRQPKTTPEWDALGWLYVHQAYTHNYNFEDYPSAIYSYRQAKSILADKLGIEDYYVAKYIYQELGNIHTRLGDYQAAEVLLQRFLDICVELGAFSDAAQAYSDLSILYVTLGRYEEAITHCRKGIQLPDIDAVAKGLLFGNMATALHAEKKYPQALEAAQQALVLFEQIAPEWKMVLGWKAGVLSLMGRVKLETDQYPAAETYHQAALLLYQQLSPAAKNRSAGKLFLSWGRLEERRHCYDDALGRIQSALASVLPGIQADNYFSQPRVSDLYAENTILEALLAKAELLEALYKQDGRLADLQLALDCHELAFEVEKQLRRSFSYESSKLLNLEESHRRCEAAIDLALQLWRYTGDPLMKARALTFAERSRSILLMEAFKRSDATSLAGVPHELVERERALQAAVAAAEERLFKAQAEGAPDSTLSNLDAQGWTARRDYADWISSIESHYPAYYNLKYNYNTASVEDIQHYLKQSKAGLISYFLGEKTLYSFVITPQSFEVVTRPLADTLISTTLNLVSNMEAFQMPGANRQQLADAYTHQAVSLYEQLLKPLNPSQLPENLLIIPDGVLSLLPFDALLSRQPAQVGQFDHYPYLLWEHNISYGYSATLQLALAQRTYPESDFAGFAPDFSGSRSFSPLRYNASTLEAAKDFMGGQLFMGADASLSHFKSNAGQYGILHLATHAQANTTSSDFSFVVFSDGAKGYDSLFVKDLYLMQLQARLVVLSACQTAVGRVFRGEGVISLARAFLCAGAGSVINTLWRIDDVANRDIMSNFYKNIKKGETTPTALRQAKKAYLERADSFTGHPAYWAGFVGVGELDAVRPTWRSWWSWAAGGGLLLLIGLLFGGIGKWGSGAKLQLSRLAAYARLFLIRKNRAAQAQ